MYQSAEGPLFFQSEMVPRQYRCIRWPEAGGMHRLSFQDLSSNPAKSQKPAARFLWLNVRPSAGSAFHLKKKRAFGTCITL